MYYPQHTAAYGRQIACGLAYSVETRRAVPSRRSAVRLSPRAAQVVFFVLFVCLAIATTYLLVHVLGLDNIAQLHGIDHVASAMGIEAPPEI